MMQYNEEEVRRAMAEIRARMARDRRRMIVLSVVLVLGAVAVVAVVLGLVFRYMW